jgi:hypothetical protein
LAFVKIAASLATLGRLGRGILEAILAAELASDCLGNDSWLGPGRGFNKDAIDAM